MDEIVVNKKLNDYITINNYIVYDDSARIVEVIHNTEGVDGFQVDLNITATNKQNEVKDFVISLQSEDRTNVHQIYSGFEMYFALNYGVDYDESKELDYFLDYDKEKSMDDLIYFCEKLCEEWYENKLKDKYEDHKKGMEDVNLKLIEYLFMTYEDIEDFIKKQKNKLFSEVKEYIENGTLKKDKKAISFIHDYFFEKNNIARWILREQEFSYSRYLYYFDENDYSDLLDIMHDACSDVVRKIFLNKKIV